MSTDKDRHDYSLLGSFMPKDVPDPRPSIPVEIRLGDDTPATPSKPSATGPAAEQKES